MGEFRKKTTLSFQVRMVAGALLATAAFLAAASVAAPEDNGNLDPTAVFEAQINAWFAADDSLATDVAARERVRSRIFDELFDFEKLASQMLQQHWAELTPYQRGNFVAALKRSIGKYITQHTDRAYASRTPALHLLKRKVGERFASVEYLISAGSGPGQQDRVTVYFLRTEQGQWKVSNAKIGRTSLMRHYFSICDAVLDDYDIEYLVAELGEYDSVTIEDFEGSELDTLPAGWGWKSKDDDKYKPYRVRKENGNKYLEATDEGQSIIIGRQIKWNIRKYPYISFRWRAHKLPAGADERYNKTVDSAAGIYITYKFKLGLIPESVKYVWSSTLPVGSAMRRSGVGRPWMVVAESGEENVGEWHTYVFNAYEAYQKTFGGNPPDKAMGVGILSDANSMHSQAYADYDDIKALKNADTDSGVRKILKAE